MASRIQLRAVGRIRSWPSPTMPRTPSIGISPNRSFHGSSLSSRPVRPSGRSGALALGFVPGLSRTFFWGSTPTTKPALPETETVNAQSTAATLPTTTPSTSSPPPPADAVSPLSGYEIPDITQSTLPELLSIPPTAEIGYLKSLGLNYSIINPANYLEWTLEHVHVYSSMPWWASIVTTTLLFRILLLRFAIVNNETYNKIAILAPVTKPLTYAITKATREKNMEVAAAKRAELVAINRRMGTSTWNMFRFPAMQAVIGFGTFKVLRDMAAIPVPGLETGGFGWITDLAVPDPYYLLPLAQFCIMSGSVILIRSRSQVPTTMSQGTSTAVAFGMATLMGGFSAFMPAGLQIAFLTSALFQQSLNLTFTFPLMRQLFRLSPLPTQAQTEPEEVTLNDKITVASWQTAELAPSSSTTPATAVASPASRDRILRQVQKKAAEPAKPFFRDAMDKLNERLKELGYARGDDSPASNLRERGKKREREWYETYRSSIRR